MMSNIHVSAAAANFQRESAPLAFAADPADFFLELSDEQIFAEFFTETPPRQEVAELAEPVVLAEQNEQNEPEPELIYYQAPEEIDETVEHFVEEPQVENVVPFVFDMRMPVEPVYHYFPEYLAAEPQMEMPIYHPSPLQPVQQAPVKKTRKRRAAEPVEPIRLIAPEPVPQELPIYHPSPLQPVQQAPVKKSRKRRAAEPVEPIRLIAPEPVPQELLIDVEPEPEWMDSIQLGEVLKEKLHELGISQTDFAHSILSRCQGTLADIFRLPKVWETISLGRGLYFRMAAFMKLSDEQMKKIVKWSPWRAQAALGFAAEEKLERAAPKKPKTVFNEDQRIYMELYFLEKSCPEPKEIQKIAEELDLKKTPIRTFFTNLRKRGISKKRMEILEQMGCFGAGEQEVFVDDAE